jgi:hypothetical protein
MTDDKIKAIAKITLANSRLIGGLSGFVGQLVERLVEAQPNEPGAIGLLHEFEQLQALLRDLQPSLDLAEKEIDDPDDQL